MELNSNKKADLKDARYPEVRHPEVRQAAETRSAELRATVERVQSSAEENAEALSRLKTRTDTIELSTNASATEGAHEAAFQADRSERIAELRASVEDGSLFDRERLELAAERLLSRE